MKTPDCGKFFLFISLVLSFNSYGQEDSTIKKNYPDSNTSKLKPASFVSVAANPQLKGTGLKQFLIGKNYRQEWTQPITVPILDLQNESGGLVPEKQGGGKETRSLKLKDTLGRTWALRSVRKYPENAVPPEFRKTVAETLITDDISASYPYGVMSMSVFSKAAGVPFLKNKIVYIPDDPALGKFRSKFKNTLVFLEQRFPEGIAVPNNAQDEEKTTSTEKLVYDLAKNNNNKVDQLSVLRARLLDNFVMDFDRHEGQWSWLGIDSAGGKIYYPIPKDRDQVFFTNQGFLTRLAGGKEYFPELQGFRAKPKDIIRFNRAARNFDRSFLNELSQQDWSQVTDSFLHTMTDSVIETALQQQPKEIQHYSAQKIISILKQKREYFKDDMMKYYKALSKTVAIVGSNQREQFIIRRNTDETVLISVYKIDSLGNASSKIYERLFDPEVTKEIQLYGLEDDDKFIAEGGKSKIKIRMIGGPGDDQFINKGSGGKLLAYDVTTENNTIDKGIRNKITGDPQNNTYTRLGYIDNNNSLGPSFQVSAMEGIFVGIRVKIQKQGFRKEPYASKQLFVVTHSINSSSYRLRYNADFIHALNKTDLLVRSDLIIPTNKTNFFGFGNNTAIDPAKTGDRNYYHVHYDIGNFSLLARNIIGSAFQIQYGGSFQYIHLRPFENRNNYVASLLPSASDEYRKKYYAGAEIHLVLNTRNSEVIATRGIVFNTYARLLAGLNAYSYNIAETGGNFIFYTDFIAKNRIILASNFGAAHNFGRYEIAQAQYLGRKDNLRGFRVERFAGRSVAYNNTELRIKLTNLNLYLFPAAFGIFGFNDIGRVWADSEVSTHWHDGYGGGIWLAPVNRIVVTGSLAFSNEEKRGIGLATIGFEF